MAVCGDEVRPVRVVWSDMDGEQSTGLGGFHKLLAQHPALGLAVLCGLKRVGARPPLLGAVGPLEALQAHFVGTLGGVMVWGVRMRGFGGGWEVGREGK